MLRLIDGPVKGVFMTCLYVQSGRQLRDYPPRAVIGVRP